MNNDHQSCRGAMTLSLGFYLGMGALLLVLVAGAVIFPAPPKPIDEHANPAPATPRPAQVVIAPGSNLYHASAACSYAHKNAKPLSTSEAERQGFIPCPYCVGNSSSGRLSPVVIAASQR